MPLSLPPTAQQIAEIEETFNQPPPPPPDNTFEVGLVLGGTVSAGAYTAGVIDFLMEALDEWTKQREAERGRPASARTVPTHDVKIKVITGASGGGVIGSIFARAMPFDFPHVNHPTPEADRKHNPFYDVWVNRLDIGGLTETSDVQAGRPAASLLSPRPLESAAETLAAYPGASPVAPVAFDRRRYIADPLELVLTLTNLRGIPYATDFGAADEYFVEHADFVRFLVGVSADGTFPALPPRPLHDAMVVTNSGQPLPGSQDLSGISWRNQTQFALATGAFPGGFPARRLRRPPAHYAYRPALTHDDGGRVRVTLRQPAWGLLGDLTADYAFDCVDGGTMNNQPLALARFALSGHLGREPRDPRRARRGVILVDPFAEPPVIDPPPGEALPLRKALPDTFFGLVGQARYATADPLLADDDGVLARFLIRPERVDAGRRIVGGRAIASAGLNAFMGFLSLGFRQHDYFLGRQNCQAFLRERFVVHRDNPLFRRDEVNANLTDWQPQGAMLPLIPLVTGSAGIPRTAEDLKPQPWPRVPVKLGPVRQAFERRIPAVVAAVTQGVRPEGLFARLFLDAIVDKGADGLVDLIMEQIKAEARDWDLPVD